MDSRQRAFLKGIAMKEDAVLQIGKSGLSPAFTQQLDEALRARELVKINVQKNFPEEEGGLRKLAGILAERTHSEIVQIIGRKIVFFRQKPKDSRITLPRAQRKS